MDLSNVRRRLLVVAIAVVAVMVASVSPAGAHDPIFLSDDQTTPDTGPYMPDGSISWALYGTVLEAGDTRGFEFDLRDGDELVVSLLIPNLDPELQLSTEELPIVELEHPDGTTETIVPTTYDVFDEPFSNTSYVTLHDLREPGQAGRYRGVVIGNAPARFSVAIGINEIFFTETERSGDRPSSFAEISAPLNAWYSTPPGAEAPTGDLAEGEAEIDLDMIEDAMESGEADAPEGATDAADESDTAADDTAADDTAADDDDTSDSDADESAAAADDGGDDSDGLGWVAPVALIAILTIGGAAYAVRRRTSA